IRADWALMVIPRSRLSSMFARYWSCASRSLTVPVFPSNRSDSVDLPWSMCAMIEKLRRCWFCSGIVPLPGARGITREAATHNGESGALLLACGTFSSGAREANRLQPELAAEPGDRRLQPFFQVDLRLPAEQRARPRDVRAALLWIVLRERPAG